MNCCNMCLKVFQDKDSLCKHLHDRHKYEKPFICDVCYMQFSCNDELTEHSDLHSGTNLFPCAFCAESFPTTQSLVHHLYECGGVDRLSNCGSDSELLQSDEELYEEKESGVSCKSCHAVLSKAESVNYTCLSNDTKNLGLNENDSEEKLCGCDTSTETRQSKNDLIEQKHLNEEEKIFCVICRDTLPVADLMTHSCVNSPIEKLDESGNYVYQIKSIKSSENEMHNDSDVFNNSLQSKKQTSTYKVQHEKCVPKSSLNLVHKCLLSQKSNMISPDIDNDKCELCDNNADKAGKCIGELSFTACNKSKHKVSKYENVYASNHVFKDKNHDNHAKNDFSSLSREGASTSNCSDSQAAEEDAFPSHSIESAEEADLVNETDNFVFKSNSKISSVKGVSKRTLSNCTEKQVDGKLSDETLHSSSPKKIVEVIIVEENSSNAHLESGCEDTISSSDIADIDSSSTNDSDTFDTSELKSEYDLNSNSVSKKFNCPICPLVFSFKQNLTRHLKNIHSESHFDVESIKTHKTKRETKQPFSCNFCSKQFSYLQSLKSHMSFFHLNENDSGVCHKCDQVYDDPKTGKPHKCPKECTVCGKVCKTFYLLTQHMNKHYAGQTFNCPQCSLVFTFKHNLKRHLKNMHSETSLECKICKMSFSTKQFLKTHLKQAHFIASYQCKECGLSSMTYQKFLKHWKLVHKSGQSFLCPLCGKDCNNGAQLDEHLLLHKPIKELECPECHKKFLWPKTLKRHLKKHIHGKAINCPQCDKNFYTKYQLQVHLRVHTGEKPYQCQQCGRRFSQQGSLMHHMLIHSNERHPCDESHKSSHECEENRDINRKIYKCTYCGKSFYSNGHLKIHLRVHTGEKPYQCEECGKRFSQQGSLKYHMRIHTGEKPYTCSECQKSFKYMGTFKSHKCHGTKNS